MTRACGPCSACCTSLAVHEIGKPAFVKCCDVVEGGGCAIYAQRPPSCAIFTCLWIGDGVMQSGLTREEDRPDVSGLVFTATGGDLSQQAEFARKEGFPGLQAFEAWECASRAYRAQKLLQRVARRAIVVVAHFNSTERSMYGPEAVPRARLRELGAIAQRNAIEEQRKLESGELPVSLRYLTVPRGTLLVSGVDPAKPGADTSTEIVVDRE